ncbi:Mechanosensitive ion channel [Neorhodopirellula lusitana]|uniref:Mechanosensitive ion channel n=1 Tax=Neorhodopirellula lusitana TaxID=445327 RepID=A0ABY1QAV4_9BACT|nr:mechanosensitive ion channel domain-containing protein [Neorhodopirellula lusitana]SMP62365.1 Mechanosensitive ion channel [Neorhodopirellula lusitana]
MVDAIVLFVPFLAVVISVSIMLGIADWLLIKRQPDIGKERLFSRQLIMLGLTVLGVLIAVLVLPISDSSRNQLIALIGILLSGIFAFSSTTATSNLMAGVLLRITSPFGTGDFIRVGEHFGRVSERGLFDTEIQTETRELISLPNNYLISHPVTTTRRSGTIVSAELSLGYDVDHRKIESLLVEAAKTCGLAEPFVHVLALGNFAVSYRVSGFLEEPKRLISIRSNLYGCVLDTLHGNEIEIVSPTFMNQRRIEADGRIIPTPDVATSLSVDPEFSVEDIAFDKAEKAERLEDDKLQLMEEIKKQEVLFKQATGDDEKKTAHEAIEQAQERLAALQESADPPGSESPRGGESK